MLEKPEQIDFFAKLKPAKEIRENQPVEKEVTPTLKSQKIKIEKIKQGSNIPSGGRLGGWESHYDGNVNDYKIDKKWKR